MAPVLKILGVPRLPPGGSLGTGKRVTVPKDLACPANFFSGCKWGFNVSIIDNCPQRKKGKIVHDQGASNISVFASVSDFVFALIQSVSASSNFFLLRI